MAILNSELEMLAPVLMAPRLGRPQWLDTSHPNVKAAHIQTKRGAILLPIWLGKGNQYVPEQGALPSLTVVVPLVEDGADPWRISPAGVECLRNTAEKVPGGTKLTIPEFDLVTPIVFTNDQSQTGLVVWWQDYARKYGRLAARWALDMAAEEHDKVLAVHTKLTEMGVTVPGADKLFEQSVKFHVSARQHFAVELYDKAFADANRALRPLRVVMRDHWERATATLDVPTASPFAVSYFSLPKHWELFREVQACQPAPSLLSGAFEPGGDIPSGGVALDQIPGWSARFGTLDRVDVAAGVVPSAGLEDPKIPRPKAPQPKMFGPSRPITLPGDGYTPPAPELGKGVLKLEVRQRGEVGKDGKPIGKSTHPLERTFLVAESSAVRVAPGSLVRISGWVKIPNEIRLTADGVLFYDDIGGEPLGVRASGDEGRVEAVPPVPARARERSGVAGGGADRRRGSVLRRPAHRTAGADGADIGCTAAERACRATRAGAACAAGATGGRRAPAVNAFSHHACVPRAYALGYYPTPRWGEEHAGTQSHTYFSSHSIS